MVRPALFTLVAVVWCVRSLQSFSDPDFMDPRTASDWFAVLSFSGALFALAFALPLFARSTGGGRVVFRASLVPAVGAALAGFGNLLEDALSLGFAFWLFVAGSVLTLIGLIAITPAVALACRGRRRLLAAVPAATLTGMLLFENGGGVVIAAAWLVVAAMSLRLPARETAPAVPMRP
jgi:hypothetical protein